jgi:ribosomal-protein-alanine N-acetyltransferase
MTIQRTRQTLWVVVATGDLLQQCCQALTADDVDARTGEDSRSQSASRAFLAEAIGQATDPERRDFSFAVALATGELVGSAAITVTSIQHKRGEFGFLFHSDVWSQGYATEAGKLLVHFGFQRLKLRRISTTCHPNNHASARVLQKVGLEYEGRIRSHLFVR